MSDLLHALTGMNSTHNIKGGKIPKSIFYRVFIHFKILKINMMLRMHTHMELKRKLKA